MESLLRSLTLIFCHDALLNTGTQALNGESERSTILIFIFLFAVALLFYSFRIHKKFSKNRFKPAKAVNPDIWFYSKLTDIEIGSYEANYFILSGLFLRFILYKYRMHFPRETKAEWTDQVFQTVKKHESNKKLIDLYGKIYNEIELLKQKKSDDVLSYVKKLKKEFFRDSLNMQNSHNYGKDCNNC